jgi:hypothetical protein
VPRRGLKRPHLRNWYIVVVNGRSYLIARFGSDSFRHHNSRRKMACFQHKQRVKGKHRTWYATTLFSSRRIWLKVNLILQSSSSSNSNIFTAQAPSVQPSSLPIQEAFYPSKSQHMVSTPVKCISVEVGSSISTGLSQGPAVENISLEMPL